MPDETPLWEWDVSGPGASSKNLQKHKMLWVTWQDAWLWWACVHVYEIPNARWSSGLKKLSLDLKHDLMWFHGRCTDCEVVKIVQNHTSSLCEFSSSSNPPLSTDCSQSWGPGKWNGSKSCNSLWPPLKSNTMIRYDIGHACPHPTCAPFLPGPV